MFTECRILAAAMLDPVVEIPLAHPLFSQPVGASISEVLVPRASKMTSQRFQLTVVSHSRL